MGTTRKLKLQGMINSKLQEFEKLLSSGWTRQMIVEDLQEQGFKLTLDYFATCLHRARAIVIEHSDKNNQALAKEVTEIIQPFTGSEKKIEPKTKSTAQKAFSMKKSDEVDNDDVF